MLSNTQQQQTDQQIRPPMQYNLNSQNMQRMSFMPLWELSGMMGCLHVQDMSDDCACCDMKKLMSSDWQLETAGLCRLWHMAEPR